MDCIWPKRTTRPLRQLTESQYAAWERDGYLVLPGIVPLDLCANAATTIRTFIGADDSRPGTWYTNTQDIYDARLSPRPAHGPCGMVQLYHHATLWALRQHPAVHACFADVYGTERLYVTCDRAHFKPPQSAVHPAWSDAGPVHSGLHWDVDTTDRPVPFSVQGVVYLEDTMADTGALRVVPACRGRLGSIDDSEAVAVEGAAGSLILWHSATKHGPGRNTSDRPRVSAYIAMLPVDASPFLGKRPPDTALSLSDSGTLAYDEDPRRPRLSRDARIDRWPRHLPLLDEDPRESEHDRAPPGEEGGEPFGGLTPLGRRLVGLDEWPRVTAA
jgi:hypothetical protein